MCVTYTAYAVIYLSVISVTVSVCVQIIAQGPLSRCHVAQ